MAHLLTLLVLTLFTIVCFHPSVAHPHNGTVRHNSRYQERFRNTTWTSWQNVKYLFSFGNSYTSTLFDPTGPQPNVDNPFGNPPFPGATSANGPNYVGFLTAKYNHSFLRTYNLAVGGATVDADIVPPFLPIPDMKTQIERRFLPIYGDKQLVPWTAGTSLFSLFIGINDVVNSYQWLNNTIISLIMAEYHSLLTQLYQTGARNFLLMNVPPVDRSPGTILQGPEYQANESAYILGFNSGIRALAYNLTNSYIDTKVFLFDTNSVYHRILDYPAVYSQTAGIKNTTQYCQAYAHGTPNETYYDPSCGIAVNEYFWLNSLHPVWPVHDAMAAQIVNLLTS